MPQPIVPIHQQEYMPMTFGDSMQPEFQLSALQSLLLQSTAASNQNKKYSINTLETLKNIDKNTDTLVTAITEASDGRYCSVPGDVDDNSLLALKAEGLVSGYGRSVKITDRGRVALRDAYLATGNALKENRVSEKFDYRSFSRIAEEKETKKVFASANEPKKSIFKQPED